MTTIGPTIQIKGEITSAEDVRVDGRIEGHLLVQDAALTVGEGARVEADVRGTRVQIAGTLRGSVSATARIELTASAAVDGSLSANHVVIADGARFNGQIDMDRRTIAAKIAQYRSQTP